MEKTKDIGFLVPLIREVKIRPCLWNYSLKSYGRCEDTSLAWQEISDKLKDTELNCRERWKNMRCAFVRSLRPARSGSGKKRYYLADYMSFLLPYLKGNPTSGNIPVPLEQNIPVPPEQENSEDDRSSSVRNSELPSEDDNQGSSHASSSGHPSEDVSRSDVPHSLVFEKSHRKNGNKRSFDPSTEADTAFSERLRSKKFKRQKANDADLLFFESILPDVKRLDVRSKRCFKSDVLHLLNDALDEVEERAPIAISIPLSISTDTDDSN